MLVTFVCSNAMFLNHIFLKIVAV